MAYTYTCNVLSLSTFSNNVVDSAHFTYNVTDGSNNASMNASVSFGYANNPGVYVVSNTTNHNTVNNWILTSPDTINLQPFLLNTLGTTPQEYPLPQSLFPWTPVLQFTSSATNVNVFTSNTSIASNGISYGQLTTYAVGNVYINNGASTSNPTNTSTGVASVAQLNGFTVIGTLYTNDGIQLPLSGAGTYFMTPNTATPTANAVGGNNVSVIATTYGTFAS